MKTQTTIRVDQKNYKQAKEILKYLGLSYSQAINVFNNMIICHKGLPFEIKIPDMWNKLEHYLTGLTGLARSKKM